MTWNCYRVTIEAKSPIHIGYGAKLGVVWFSADCLAGGGLMVEFVIRVNQQRTAYIPKEIVENLGYDWTMVPNAKAAVIYPRTCKTSRIFGKQARKTTHSPKIQLPDGLLQACYLNLRVSFNVKYEV